jgi:hypothetical protein
MILVLPVILFVLAFRSFHLSGRSGFSVVLAFLSFQLFRGLQVVLIISNKWGCAPNGSLRIAYLFQKSPIPFYDVLGGNGNMSNKRRQQKNYRSFLSQTNSNRSELPDPPTLVFFHCKLPLIYADKVRKI